MKNKQQVNSGFIRSLVGFSMASWVQAIIGFISIPIVTRLFVPEDYGKINMFIILSTICTIFVRLSTEQSYIRFFSDEENDINRKKLLTLCVSINLIAFCILIAVLLIFGNTISLFVFNEVNLIVIYLCLPTFVFASVGLEYQRIYFKMTEDVKKYFIFGIFTVLANKISMLIAAIYNPTYTNGIILMVGCNLLVFLWFKLYYKESMQIDLAFIDKKELNPILRYSLPFIPVTVITYLNTAVSSFILKENLSYSALGIYTSAVSVANLMSLLQVGFSVYWGPFMYNNYRTKQEFIIKVHSFVTFILTAFALGLILFSDIIFLILGEKYRLGQSFFAFLLISQVTVTIAETTCYGIYINKKTYLQIYSSVLSLIGNVIVSIITIPMFGIMGAALANAIGSIIAFAIRTLLGQREYKSVEKVHRTIVSLFILVAGAFCNYLIISTFIRTFVIIVLFTILCFTYLKELKEIIIFLLKEYHTFISKYKNAK